jgi:hypothetical protein
LLPIGHAQERVVDLGAVETQHEVVTKPLDARDLKSHLSSTFYLLP